MNAKLCKKLRKKAKELCKGNTETEYKVTKTTPLFLGQVEIALGCFRSIYKNLKLQNA